MRLESILFISHIILSIFISGCNFSVTTNNDKVNLILDTDIGPDYDDVGAMAVMHALADSGYVNILAVVSSNKSELTVPNIEIINTFFNRSGIPIGVAKSRNALSIECPHEVKWTEMLTKKYPHLIRKSTDAFDAVYLYRKLLSAQKDNSVTICTIGPLTNLKELMLSKGDSISPDSGFNLVNKKIKRLVAMGGMFPEGREYNLFSDASSSSYVIENWPTEIVFCGFEIGYNIITGQMVSQMSVENDPIKDVYSLSMSQGEPQGRWSWDQATVLSAIKGFSPYFESERGTIAVDYTGANSWIPSNNGNHIRLIESVPPNDMAELIERYMMNLPNE